MYNTFIHEQRANHQRKVEQLHMKELKWHKRYHTEVQPFLLEHYDKRINSFIHNIEEKPILMNPQNIVINQPNRKNLVFRNVEDWRSFYNIRERQQIKLHQSFLSQTNMKETHKAMPNLNTSPMKTQYRERSKQKEINPPMRYSNILKKQSIEIDCTNLKKQSLKEFIRAQRMKEKQKKMNQMQFHSKQAGNSLVTTHNSFNASKYYQQDEGDFLKHEKTDSIEIEARIYEKQREIIEKKLHFKKLLDLSVKNPQQNNRRDYKRILQRCGLLRIKKSINKTQTSELDKFLSIVQTTDRARQNK